MVEKRRKPYERPAIVFERDLEALALDCQPPWIGGGQTCKGQDGYCNALWT